MPRIGTSLPVAVFFVALLVATPCHSQIGACCFEPCSCQNLTEEECIAEGGLWAEGEGCQTYDCPNWLGACCYPPTWECFILTGPECAEYEGSYFVPCEICDPAP